MRIFNEYESEVEDPIGEEKAPEITETKKYFVALLWTGLILLACYGSPLR